MTRTNPLLPTSSAAPYCNYSERQFIRMRNEGRGPAYIKTAHKILYRQSDLDAWLDAQRIVPVRSEVSA